MNNRAFTPWYLLGALLLLILVLAALPSIASASLNESGSSPGPLTSLSPNQHIKDLSMLSSNITAEESAYWENANSMSRLLSSSPRFHDTIYPIAASYFAPDAPTGTPITVTISRSGDDTVLSWLYDPSFTSYDIWSSTDPYFLPGDPGAFLLSTLPPPTSGSTLVFTDTGVISDTSTNSYYLISALDSLSATSLSNATGEFAASISPGWNLLSWPLLPITTTLDGAVGDQLTGSEDPTTADRVLVWNGITQSYDSAWYCGGQVCESWGEPWADHWLSNDYSPSPLSLPADLGFWVQNRSGFTETLVIVGDVAGIDRDVAVDPSWQLLGMAFPAGRELDKANLPATGTEDPTNADRVLVWDATSQSYQSAWFCGGPVCQSWGEPWADHWLANDYSPTDISVSPGQGFWLQNRHVPFSWPNLRPAPDLQIAMDDGGVTPGPGSIITYTLTYTNSGNLSGMGVVISETVPANTSFNPAASHPGWSQVGATGTYTFGLGTLDVSAGGVISYGLTIGDPLPISASSITNTATIYDNGGYGADPTPVDNNANSVNNILFPLGAPTILSPADGSFAAQMVFDWSDVPGAAGYWFQLSDTNTFADLTIDRFLTQSVFTFTSEISGTHYWRVFATTTPPAIQVLLVDDDDDFPDVITYYTEALDSLGVAYNIWDTQNSDNEPDAVTLASYDAVIWFTGDEFGGAAGPGAAGETALSSFLNDGNCLFLDSQNYLYDRGLTPFGIDYLGVYSHVGQVNQTVVTGTGTVFGGLGPFNLTYPESNHSDRIYPRNLAGIAFQGDAGEAAIYRDNGIYQTTFWGFPFEALPSLADRVTTMEHFLNWCGWANTGGSLSSPTSGPYPEIRSLQLVDYFGDLDGDSLPNGWELYGYDEDRDGVIDVDLPALGAKYDHQDLFVEMDYMVRASAANGLGPNQYVLDEIYTSFANAPVSNPDGVNGITIHLDLDEEVPYDGDLNPVANEFYNLILQYFTPERAATHHYMIWANGYDGGTSSGVAFGLPGTYFLVTLGQWNSGDGGTDYQKIGTFIHELGHNLGLHHGGDDGTNYKPNYISVMNYLFQTTGVYRNGGWYNFDYQRIDLPDLNESSLDEPTGLGAGPEAAGYGTRYTCPDYTWGFVLADGPIDWNCDGDTLDLGLIVDVNRDYLYGVLDSYNDWENVFLDGGGVIGSGLPYTTF